MKRTIRYASYLMAFLGLTAVSACGDDEEEKDLCYDCEGEVYGYELDETFCYSDFKDDDYTKEEFNEYIDDLEDFGFDCTKK